MKRMIRNGVCLLMGVCLLCGCTESTITESTVYDEEYDIEVPEISADGLAWDQLFSDMSRDYENTGLYPFAGTVSMGLFENEGVIRFFLLVNEPISEKEAAEYAMDVVKGAGGLIHNQNSAYTAPGETSFGSYLDKYDIYVLVAPDDSKSDESTWILEDTIPAGEYREFSNGQ